MSDAKWKLTVKRFFFEDPIDVTVLKTYQMYIYLCSTHEGLHNLIFCLLKIFIFWKTVIFNGFLYEEDTDFHCFLQAQNIWQIYFFHMMRNHENIEFFLNYAVFDPNIALKTIQSWYHFPRLLIFVSKFNLRRK